MKKRARQDVRRDAVGPTPRNAETARLVQVEKPIYGGAFLARVDGKATFVPLTLPGEQARVRIVEDKRGYATAEADEIVEAAPQRVAPACSHFGACGGCQYQHANYAAQLEFKKAILRETLGRGDVRAPEEIAVLAAEPWGYRNRIRLALDAEGNPGYRERRSHATIAITECPIAAPLLVRAALQAGEILRERRLAVRAKEIALFCDSEECSLLMSVLSYGAAKEGFEDFARALAGKIPELKGAELLLDSRNGDLPRRVAQWGVSSLLYQAAGFNYRVDHGAFFQVNRWLVDALAEKVTNQERGGLAWDLFAGVGLFARRLAAQFEQVIAVESAAAATEALTENLKGTNATAVKAATVDFLRGAAKSKRADLIVPDLIVVDPPRTGLGAETTELLANIAAPALTYVSCDPATLARDLKALVATGYSIDEMTLIDLFPQTFHLETMVRMRR
jgi:23S rRNA (uracil1939-C5)-methyltransferase